MEKSYVAMGIHICPVCFKEHSDEGVILLDKKLENSLERNVVMGYAVCNEHTKDGYYTLIGINNDTNETTGEVAWARKEVVNGMNLEEPYKSFIEENGFMFVSSGLINQLNNAMQELDDDN